MQRSLALFTHLLVFLRAVKKDCFTIIETETYDVFSAIVQCHVCNNVAITTLAFKRLHRITFC